LLSPFHFEEAMHLSQVEDHRDCLQKATRKELELFAAAQGISEIDPRMAATLMRQILRAKGITNIEAQFPYLRNRTIGQMNGVNATRPGVPNPNAKVVEVDATQDLMRQWREQQARDALSMAQAVVPVAAPKTENPMAALRKECKRRGIKMSRTDKIADLRAKLDGENTSQRDQ